MTSQDQSIDGSQLEESQVQQTQAERDAVSFQDSHANQVTINNTILRLFGQPVASTVDWDWATRLLEQKQLPEIRKRLTDTLGRERQLMAVGLQEQLGWVGRSPLEAERVLQVNGNDQGSLDPRQMLIETFGRDDIAGKLLILGTPGAGKTTALLSLAEQLVCGALAQPKTAIPVLFELSTWRKDNQSIRDWLIEQLYEQHGGNRKAKLYEQWLDQQVLLPLLDGLDELGFERQQKCTQKLNEFARQYPKLVVCCRVKEFAQAKIKLNTLNGAVCLEPLSNEQIQTYLEMQKSPLWSVIESSPTLQTLLEPTAEGDPGLLKIPLFVTLAANAYDPQHPFQTRADLLSQYIDRQLSPELQESDRRNNLEKRDWAYKKPELEPDWRQTERTLAWLARLLQQTNTVEILIEQIQPSWLETKQARRQYRLIVGLIVGLIFGLIGGLNQDLQMRSRPNQGIWNSLQSFGWITLLSYPLGVVFAFGTIELPTMVAEGISEGETIGVILNSVWQVFPQFLVPGIFGALFLGFLIGGGEECVQHVCLRFVLWQSGVAPRNLAQFLNYCVERRLLQRVGGRYRFLHRELLDHFAQLHPLNFPPA